MSRAEKVIVIGGGISGLSSAVALADAGFSVKLFEKRNSLGGLIGTRRSTYGLAEAAANGIYNSISVEKFCRRLGVPLKGTLSSARARYIFVGGKARKWPIILPMSESLRFFFKLGFYRFFNRQKLVPQTNQRVSDWADKYFGGRVAHDVLSPILQGVYAAEAKDLSASLLLKGFFENKRRERKPTLRGTVAPLGGMGELIEALERAAYESNVDIIEGKAYEWEEWDNGKVPHVLATSASQASLLTKNIFPELSQSLGEIEMLPVISATLFFPTEQIPYQAFGCLFASGEGMNSLGVLFPSCIFPERSSVHVETWILGGKQRPDLVNLSEEEIVANILEDRRKLTGRDSTPLEQNIFVWREALPCYDLRLESFLAQLKEPSGLFLTGNYLGKIGIAGILQRSLELPERIRRGQINQ